MASLLRQIVAGPRSQHAETGLDLCYVTSNIIATSGPSQTYPQRAYRNPLDRLIAFLDSRHGENWAIWEFRAEGTGYPDSAVYHRIRHYPWPDHHPPPFRLVPMIMASMRNWLNGGPLDAAARGQADGDRKKHQRVVVVHCKAGKGRSGTMICSYLISECGWTPEDALARFTERRMRPRFGAGVSIPSQLRWVSYVDRWTQGGKKFVDRDVEILEVHVWGLRHGVKVSLQGFIDEGKRIKTFHTFKRDERIVVEGGAPGGTGFADLVSDMAGYGIGAAAGEDEEITEDADYSSITAQGQGAKANQESPKPINGQPPSPSSRTTSTRGGSAPSHNGNGTYHRKLGHGTKAKTITIPNSSPAPSQSSLPNLSSSATFASDSEPGGRAVIFRPAQPVRIPGSDVKLALERRNRAPRLGAGWSVVTSVAHSWFNAYFEGGGPEREGGRADEDGVFDVAWEAMDGLKGSSRRGARACDRVAVVWRVAGTAAAAAEPEPEPRVGSPVPQMRAADWKGAGAEDPGADSALGVRREEEEEEEDGGSAQLSRASSEAGEGEAEVGGEDESIKGVKSSGPCGEDVLGGGVDGEHGVAAKTAGKDSATE